MDVVFSNYRLDLSKENEDNTLAFSSLAQNYKIFRKVMRSYEEILPGRITHVRYDDLVNDTENVVRALMEKLELEFDKSTLEFHKQKRTVITASASQVRQRMYKSSLQRWKKYEMQLLPLKDLLGNDSEWNQKTVLPGYESKIL